MIPDVEIIRSARADMGAKDWNGYGNPPEDALDPDPLAAQQALADCLLHLGTTLQQRSEADPVLVLETAIAALALTRTELAAELVQQALAAAPPSQLKWWERELVDDQESVAALQAAVQAALRGPLHEVLPSGPR